MPGFDDEQLEPTLFEQKKTPFVFREQDLRDQAAKKGFGGESASESFPLSVWHKPQTESKAAQAFKADDGQDLVSVSCIVWVYKSAHTDMHTHSLTHTQLWAEQCGDYIL